MAEVTIAVVVLVSILAFFGLFAGIFFLSLKMQSRRHQQWQQCATELGLTYQERAQVAAGHVRGQVIIGMRDGVVVDAYHTSEGSGKNRIAYTYINARIEPELRLGLSLTPSNVVGELLEGLLGTRDIKIGHAAFDSSFDIKAIDADQVRAFLTPIATALMSVRSAYSRLYVTDQTVRIKLSGHPTEPALIGTALDAVVNVVKQLLYARQHTPPAAWEIMVQRSWAPFARSAGLAFDTERCTLSGVVHRQTLVVSPRWQSGRWTTCIRATLSRPLQARLQVVRQGPLSGLGKLFGMQDIELGDPRFDDSFVVKGAPEARVRALLSGPVRERILALAAEGEITVHDDRVEVVVMGLMVEPHAVQRACEEIAGAAEALTAQVAPPQAAYR